MKEVVELIRKAEKFLRTAEAALELGDHDSCVSRSYYAMFFAAEACLLSRGYRASSHKGVIGRFGQEFVKPGIFRRELGRILNEAYDWRILGDYATGFAIQEKDARDVLEKAHVFVEEVREYLKKSGALDHS